MRSSLFCVFLLIWGFLKAQDPQFSQYYSAPLYLNPAFAGSTGCTRMVSNYRNQWFGLNKPYNTFAFSMDHNIEKIKSGVGIQFLSDKVGSNGVSSVDVSLFYAYRLDFSKKYSLRAGVQVGYASKYLDIYQLSFPDQYSDDGYQSSTSSDYYNKTTRSHYADLSAGVLVYSSHMWGGLAVQHINQPNQTFTTDGGVAQLPAKFSVSGGYRFYLNQTSDVPYQKSSHGRSSITPTFLYKRQGTFNQLDLGVFLTHKPWFIGFWYRGIPLFKTVESYTSKDAIIFQAGIRFDRLNLGYSFDYTISQLNPFSKGTHEIALGYVFCTKKNCKPRDRFKTLPCPDFYGEDYTK
jgi:type IX secretion system PorP/SprF family membrane protein